MKTISKIALPLAALVALSCLFLARPGVRAQEEGEGLRIVATIYPEYDWVLQVLGENPSGIQVRFLESNGMDMHSFNPSVEDMASIADCDLFIYVGGPSDSWAEDTLKSSQKDALQSLRLMDVLGDQVLSEEVVEGMEAQEEEGEEEPDEHIWLSLKKASLCVGAIRDALCQIDPQQEEVYTANASDYQKKLADLDAAYEETISAAPGKTLLFGDRFPFLYLFRDYGLDYYAAFPGCSAETEASFETIIFLAKKVDELSLPCVMTLEGGDQKIAETIVRSTRERDQKILSLDSLQSATPDSDSSYLSIMEHNLEVLKEALE